MDRPHPGHCSQHRDAHVGAGLEGGSREMLTCQPDLSARTSSGTEHQHQGTLLGPTLGHHHPRECQRPGQEWLHTVDKALGVLVTATGHQPRCAQMCKKAKVSWGTSNPLSSSGPLRTKRTLRGWSVSKEGAGAPGMAEGILIKKTC